MSRRLEASCAAAIFVVFVAEIAVQTLFLATHLHEHDSHENGKNG